MRKKKIFSLAVIAACVVFLFSFNTNWAFGKSVLKTTPKPTPKPATVKKVTVNHPKVEFIMKNGKTMIFELYPEYAPATVANFLKLTKAKFYDGLKFHRIVKGFMIQGGDPNGDGTGGSEKTIKGEVISNGFKKNTLKHIKGVISMARSQSYDSASSQFFIVDGPAAFLDKEYAAFGKMISGTKTLEEIASTPVEYDAYGNEKSVPVKDVIIKKVIVLSDGKVK